MPSEEIRHFFESRTPSVFVCKHEQYYLPGNPVIELVVALLPAGSAPGPGSKILISEKVNQARKILAGVEIDGPSLVRLASEIEAPLLSLDGANRLIPIDIAKPWGKEVWYTGIEARGQSLVSDGNYHVPLPWLLSLSDQLMLNVGGRQVNLLKILDPLPEEVFGDLYFELHEEKQEVYVVTNIDSGAWPDGRGAIRFGFDQEVRRQYDGDDAFREAYLQSVAKYAEVRREVDKILDQCRLEAGIDLNAPVDVDRLKSWLASVPESLQQREESLRQAMNGFTAMLPLKVGDVVKVPCLTPHALQHGVRTIEFQTPVYERKILSFAQKVLTQSHWDTEDAARLMEIGPPELPALTVLEEGPGLLREQVVRFDDFEVQRLTLAPGSSWLAAAKGFYRLVISVTGAVAVDQMLLDPEEAILINACAPAQILRNAGNAGAVMLIAEPF